MVVGPCGKILCVLPYVTRGPWKTGARLRDYVASDQKHEFTKWFESIRRRERESPSISVHLKPSSGIAQKYELAATIPQSSEHEHILVVGWVNTSMPQEHRVLTQAKEAAESINALKANLFGNISHDLRTPLNGILLGIEALLDSPLSSEQKEMLAAIQSSGHELLKTLARISDYSAIMSGFWHFKSEEFRLTQSLTEIEADFARQASEKALQLKFTVDTGIPNRMQGDIENLSHIIRILTENAIKFTQQGFVSIHVHKRAIDNDLITLVLEVLDSGIGIEERSLEWISEPFRKVDATDSDLFHSMGLGLAICQILAIRLESRLNIESAVGEGSRFWLKVNFARCH